MIVARFTPCSGITVLVVLLSLVAAATTTAAQPSFRLPLRVDFACGHGFCFQTTDRLDALLAQKLVVGALNATREPFLYRTLDGDYLSSPLPVLLGVVVHPASGRFSVRQVMSDNTGSTSSTYVCCTARDNVAYGDPFWQSLAYTEPPPRALTADRLVNYIEFVNGTLLPDDGTGTDAYHIANDTFLFSVFGNTESIVLFNHSTGAVVRWCATSGATAAPHHQWCGHANNTETVPIQTGVTDDAEWISIDDTYTSLFSMCRNLPTCGHPSSNRPNAARATGVLFGIVAAVLVVAAIYHFARRRVAPPAYAEI